MLLIGLTGSIATGKSTVSHLLSSPPYSLPLIDADLLAREVVQPGTPAYKKIVEHFGPTTPNLLLPASPSPSPSPSPPSTTAKSSTDTRGRPLDRAALGRRVFGNTPSRQRDRKTLNSIIHPAVRLAIARSILYYYILGCTTLVLDIPLLYESALDPFVSFVLLIASSPATQAARLRTRDPHLSSEDARDRIGSQMSVGEKVERTEYRGRDRSAVVWNEGSREELEGRIRVVVRELVGGRKWWGWWLWGSPYVAGAVAGWEVWTGWRRRVGWERERERRRRTEEKGKDTAEGGKLGLKL